MPRKASPSLTEPREASRGLSRLRRASRGFARLRIASQGFAWAPRGFARLRGTSRGFAGFRGVSQGFAAPRLPAWRRASQVERALLRATLRAAVGVGTSGDRPWPTSDRHPLELAPPHTCPHGARAAGGSLAPDPRQRLGHAAGELRALQRHEEGDGAGRAPGGAGHLRARVRARRPETHEVGSFCGHRIVGLWPSHRLRPATDLRRLAVSACFPADCGQSIACGHPLGLCHPAEDPWRAALPSSASGNLLAFGGRTDCGDPIPCGDRTASGDPMA